MRFKPVDVYCTKYKNQAGQTGNLFFLETIRTFRGRKTTAERIRLELRAF